MIESFIITFRDIITIIHYIAEIILLLSISHFIWKYEKYKFKESM